MIRRLLRMVQDIKETDSLGNRQIFTVDFPIKYLSLHLVPQAQHRLGINSQANKQSLINQTVYGFG